MHHASFHGNRCSCAYEVKCMDNWCNEAHSFLTLGGVWQLHSTAFQFQFSGKISWISLFHKNYRRLFYLQSCNWLFTGRTWEVPFDRSNCLLAILISAITHIISSSCHFNVCYLRKGGVSGSNQILQFPHFESFWTHFHFLKHPVCHTFMHIITCQSSSQ